MTGIQISNDDAGKITFALTFANRPPLAGQDLINVGLDVDLAARPSTGLNGIDFILVAGPSGSGLLKWNGTEFAPVTAPSFSTAVTNVLTIEINESDLGLSGPDILVGFVVRTSGDGKTVGDTAPDSYLPGGIAVYEIRVNTTPAIPLRLTGTLTAGRALHGRRFRVTLLYMRSDAAAPTTGELTGKTISCQARVVGMTLRPVERESGGALVNCAWLLPKTSKGKTLTGSVTVAFASVPTAKLTLRFSRKIG